MAKINNWYYVANSLIGYVTDHPRQAEFSSNEYQRTSRVMGKRGDKVITRNTTYELGEPHPSSPHTKADLLAELQEV